MKKIKLVGNIGKGLYTLVDDDVYKVASKYHWFLSAYGYAERNNRGKFDTKSNKLHHFVITPPKGYHIDHINRNKLDNRRTNLRIVTPSENLMNRPRQCNNKSGYKGVSWSKLYQNWAAQLKINGKQTNLGRYSHPRYAAMVYDIWAKDSSGKHAYLNFPNAKHG